MSEVTVADTPFSIAAPHANVPRLGVAIIGRDS